MNKIVKSRIADFDNDLQAMLGDNYLDTIIYGSYSLDDFRIGKSDIDFCVVLERDLSDAEIEKIIKLHESYYQVADNEITFFEGYYYPKKALVDIRSEISGYKIAAARNMWRKMDKFLSNCFELIQFSTNGIRLRNKKFDVMMPSAKMILGSMKKGLELNRKWIGDCDVPSYLIIQYVARCIYYINQGEIGSKKNACDYLAAQYPGNDYFKASGDLRKPFDVPDVNGKYQNHLESARKALDIFEDVLNRLDHGDLIFTAIDGGDCHR